MTPEVVPRVASPRGDGIRNVFLTGVGGHGVLAVSRVIAEAALAAGFDVRRSEVHEMSQRGGSVVSQVRYGDRVHSPLIPEGEGDVMIALELLEAVRHLQALRCDGILLVNEQRITPAPPGARAVPYPEDPRSLCASRVERAFFFPALAIARELGSERAANMVMLGAYSLLTPEIRVPTWLAVLGSAFRDRFREVNEAAFRRGRDVAEHAISVEGEP